MKRRQFVLVTLASLAAPRAALAQSGRKIWRVGYLSLASPEADRQWVEALRQGLRALGYVEGQNLVLEIRHAGQQLSRVSDLAVELDRREVAVMVVYGSPAIAVVKRTLPAMAVVMTAHADPVGTGVVASMARPGGRITGFTDGHADLAPKRLEILKEAVPTVSRVAVMLNPATLHAGWQLKLLQAAAPKLGVAIIPIELKGPDEIERSFERIVKERADAVFYVPDPTWWTGQVPRIANLSIKNRLPSIGTVREFADGGVLLAYGTNFSELWRRSATYVDKILKGANPADLPIDHPTKFDLVINLKTAKALGIPISKALIMRAEQVIE